MKIKLDENGYVVGYVTLGDMDGAEKFDGEIPDDFADNCCCYRLVDGELVLDAEKKSDFESAESAHGELAELYAFLSNTDYQIIKSYEYALNGLPEPYDLERLHAERQATRDRINELTATAVF